MTKWCRRIVLSSKRSKSGNVISAYRAAPDVTSLYPGYACLNSASNHDGNTEQNAQAQVLIPLAASVARIGRGEIRGQNVRMTKLGPEYKGKLPPGAAIQLRKSLASYRKAASMGVRVSVAILPPSDCSVSEAQRGTLYSLDGVPKLPFPGCTRSPCCGCCYSPVTKT